MEADIGTICNSAEGEQGGTHRPPPPTPPLLLRTVARWPKILQNNSKGAAKNIFWPRKIGGRTAPNFDQKGPENIVLLFLVFSGAVWSKGQFLVF